MEITVKRRKLLFVERDGHVLAESSKEHCEDTDSSLTRVVSVDDDEYWRNDNTQAKAESYQMENRQEQSQKSTREIRRFNFIKSYDRNMNMTERESFLKQVRVKRKICEEKAVQKHLLFVDRNGRVL